MDKATIHSRYKDLSIVEAFFRAMKKSHLEIRPVFLNRRRENKTTSSRIPDLYDAFCGILYLLNSGYQWRIDATGII